MGMLEGSSSFSYSSNNVNDEDGDRLHNAIVKRKQPAGKESPRNVRRPGFSSQVGKTLEEGYPQCRVSHGLTPDSAKKSADWRRLSLLDAEDC